MGNKTAMPSGMRMGWHTHLRFCRCGWASAQGDAELKSFAEPHGKDASCGDTLPVMWCCRRRRRAAFQPTRSGRVTCSTTSHLTLMLRARRRCVRMCVCDCIACMYEIVGENRKGANKTRIILIMTKEILGAWVCERPAHTHSDEKAPGSVKDPCRGTSARCRKLWLLCCTLGSSISALLSAFSEVCVCVCVYMCVSVACVLLSVFCP